MLHRLPGELLAGVIKELPKRDLKTLSLVSRHMRSAVENDLWRSITILDDEDIADLPRVCLDLATQLHFRSEDALDNCLHKVDEQQSWFETGDEEYIEEEVSRRNSSQFIHISDMAWSVLEKFSRNQLDSFSWELSTCVPSTILGSHGIVTVNQNSVKSLSLITDSTCSQYYEGDCDIDLSLFRQLHSLCWKAPNSENLQAISDAVRVNAAQLQKLELDFVDWPGLKDNLEYDSDDDGDRDKPEQSYFTREILDLDSRSLQPCFQNIRTMSLSQVPLGMSMARAINFDTLLSLSLRNCPNWESFLERVMELGLSIRLRTLEIQASDSVTSGMGDYVMRDFLDAFNGLEELFIYEMGPQHSIRLYNHVVRHRATLRKFVHHQRAVDIDEESPNFEKEHDQPDLSITGRDMRLIKERPLENPLAQLDLKFIGLACLPERLKYVLLPFSSLPFLGWAESHPRLPAGFMPMDSENGGLEGSDVEGSEMAVSLRSWADSGPYSEAEGFAEPGVEDVGLEQKEILDRLRPEFRQFAEWVFGSQGIPSVQFVFHGDFSYGRQGRNIALQRCMAGDINFRYLNPFRLEWEETFHEYRHELGVCPSVPSLVGHLV